MLSMEWVRSLLRLTPKLTTTGSGSTSDPCAKFEVLATDDASRYAAQLVGEDATASLSVSVQQ